MSAAAADLGISERSVAEAAQSSPTRRTVWLILTAVTIFAAGLRLSFLDHQSLWLDEIYTRSILRESSLAGLWRHIEATESTPPLYYALGWLIKARSAAAMRLIPALALSATVPVSYLAFRRLVGSRAALATAAILAVNPMLVAYSTDARSYGLFVLTALLSVWAFSALLEARSVRRYVLWVLASVSCVWTHYFGVFVVFAEILALLHAHSRERRLTLSWTVLLGLLLVPLIPLLSSQTDNERAGYIAGIPLTKRVSETVRQFAMGANVPRTLLEAAGLLVFYLAITAGVWIALRSAPKRSRVLLALAAIALATPLLLSVLKIENRFYARNVIETLPLVAALGAPAMLRLRAAPLVVYLVLAGVTSIWVATNWRYEQVDWRGALNYAQRIDSSAAVVAVNYMSAPVIETYLARHAEPSTISSRQAWIIVEPVRTAKQRALRPAPAQSLQGFTELRSLQLHGFRLILVGAPKPTPIAPAEVTGATLFAGSS